MISRQQFIYYTKTKKGKLYGETTVNYTNYELKKNFKKGFFGNEVSTTSIQAYEKDSVFWKSVRKEPLSKQQALYAKYQDSVYAYQHSEAYLDSMDRILNKITWKKMLIFGQIFNDHKKERMWILPPITSLIQPISFGGARIHLSGAYRKTYPNRKTLSMEADLSYGFRNKDVNGMVSVVIIMRLVFRYSLVLLAGLLLHSLSFGQCNADSVKNFKPKQRQYWHDEVDDAQRSLIKWDGTDAKIKWAISGRNLVRPSLYCV